MPTAGAFEVICRRLILSALSVVAFVCFPAHAQSTDSTDLVDDVMAYLGFDVSNKSALLDGEVVFTGMPGMEPLPEAVAHRLALMNERKYHKQDWNEREIGLCEH